MDLKKEHVRDYFTQKLKRYQTTSMSQQLHTPQVIGVPGSKGAKQFNYSEMWDRSPSIATAKQPLLSSEKVIKGYPTQMVKDLTPNLKFIAKH